SESASLSVGALLSLSVDSRVLRSATCASVSLRSLCLSLSSLSGLWSSRSPRRSVGHMDCSSSLLNMSTGLSAWGRDPPPRWAVARDGRTVSAARRQSLRYMGYPRLERRGGWVRERPDASAQSTLGR